MIMQQKMRTIGVSNGLLLGLLLFVNLFSACGAGTSSKAQTSPPVSPTLQPTAQPTPTPLDRHGIPNDVPLPDEATFHSQDAIVTFKVGPITILHQFSAGCLNSYVNKTWVWTISSTPTTVESFYQKSFTDKGGSTVFQATGCHVDNVVIAACKGGIPSHILLVEISTTIVLVDTKGQPSSTITAPAGGSVIALHVDSDQHTTPNPSIGITTPTLADTFCR